jgi:hypothetical protein
MRELSLCGSICEIVGFDGARTPTRAAVTDLLARAGEVVA